MIAAPRRHHNVTELSKKNAFISTHRRLSPRVQHAVPLVRQSRELLVATPIKHIVRDDDATMLLDIEGQRFDHGLKERITRLAMRERPSVSKKHCANRVATSIARLQVRSLDQQLNRSPSTTDRAQVLADAVNGSFLQQ